MVPDNQLAVKWERLDVHHIEFQSCGGTDVEENLVPLCPNCHTTLHSARRNGDDFVTDQDLLDTWNRWKELAEVVPATLALGHGAPVQFSNAVLDIYGIVVRLAVDGGTSYADFRSEVLARIVNPLRAADDHFPFLRGGDSSQWVLSSDDTLPQPWDEASAANVLVQHPGDLRMGCPMMVLLTRDPQWLASFLDHHRWL